MRHRHARLWVAALAAMTAMTAIGAIAAVSASAAAASEATPRFAPVVPGAALEFPRDFGSHPEFRTEWWYVTGWLSTPHEPSLGFQITFFRAKPAIDDDNPSAFAARQLLIAHGAISDPAHGRLWHDQIIRRGGFGLVGAAIGDTEVRIDGWTLGRTPGPIDGNSSYLVDVNADQLLLQLSLTVTQAPMLNGDSGFSRKGPAPDAASYYYSVPHLRVTGRIRRGSGAPESAQGEAWLDHEWSSEYLDPEAVGWDWTGINLDDGGALMVFRIRDSHGAARFAGATLRDASGRTRTLPSSDIRLTPLRTWISPRTGIPYPVAWQLHAGGMDLKLAPLMDDQENDARLSTGAVYWEGAIRALQSNRPVGRGYLELTGYGERLRLR
jgi:predicted secreted hydrolase